MVTIPAGGTRIILAIALAASIGGGIYFAADREEAPPEQVASLDAAAGQQPAPPALTVHEPASAAPEATAAPPPAAPAGDPPPPPRFDVVRVDPGGAGLIAGRAEPGARVTVRAGTEALAEVEAGPGGDFVAVFRVAPSATPRELVLETGPDADRRRSDETVLLLPPAPADAPATAAAAPARATAADPEAEADAEDGAFVAATAIVRPESETVEIDRGDGIASRGGGLTLGSVTYSREGEVTLAGFASAGARVRVYVDGAHARDTVAGDDGRWRLDIDELDGGVYDVRIDEVRDDGTVASRVETPFQRDFPGAPGGAGEHNVTVQPGSNLWTIARLHYGQGVLYTQIYTANTELIRDPDLIYPGQIFRLPEIEGASAGVVEGPLARR